MGNTAYASTISSGSVSDGRTQAQGTGRSSTIIPEEKWIMVRVPTHRPPTHPGEMLLEEFLEPLRITQTELAERIEVPFQRVNSLVNGRRALTPDTALRLSRVFGTTPGFWMNHQLRWDLYHAELEARVDLRRIKPIRRKDLATSS